MHHYSAILHAPLHPALQTHCFAPHKAVSAPVRRSALRLRVPRKPVLQPVLKPGHLASDVEKNVAEMFSANHGGAAR